MRSYSTEEFLTVAEVASLLRLNEQTVRNWIDDKKLPAFRIGRRVRVARSDLDDLVQSGYTATDVAEATPAQAFWDGAEDVGFDAQAP